MAEDRDDLEILQTIATRGGKGLAEILKRQGFVDASTVDQRIEQRALELSTQQQLRTDYPELADRTSDLYKAAEPRFNELLATGIPKALAMKLAVEQAELDGYKSGKRQTPGQRQASLAQERAQSSKKDEQDEELTDLQKRVCEEFGVDHDTYRRRAR